MRRQPACSRRPFQAAHLPVSCENFRDAFPDTSRSSSDVWREGTVVHGTLTVRHDHRYRAGLRMKHPRFAVPLIALGLGLGVAQCMPTAGVLGAAGYSQETYHYRIGYRDVGQKIFI